MKDDFSHMEVFLALGRECARLLRAAQLPGDFAPRAPLPPFVPQPSLLRHLGAPSLSDFYALAIGDGRAMPKTPPLFPEGPESIKPAKIALDLEIARLKAAPEKNNPETARGLEILQKSRSRLTLAQRLWPRIKKEALLWPEEAEKRLQTALRLEDGVLRVLKIFQAESARNEDEEEAPPRRPAASFTAAAATLRRELEAALSHIEAKRRAAALWAEFSDEMEGLAAAAGDSADEARDWAEVKLEAERRFTALKRENARLSANEASAFENLKNAMEILAGAEEGGQAPGEGKILRERLETAILGADALMASAHDQRRRLAALYFTLPASLGRPVFLEKTHLATAAAIGRTQAALEETKRRIGIAFGSLSSAQALREKAKAALSAFSGESPRDPGIVAQGERRLCALARAIEQKLALRRVISQSAETETELSRSLLDNQRLSRHLKTAALESEQMAEELAAARSALGELGRFKAKLLKLYGQKNELLAEAEASRQNLLLENAELTAARAELRRKRARLAAIYKLEKGDLKRVAKELGEERAEAGVNRELIEAAEAERRELEQKLENARNDRDKLAAEQKELETRASLMSRDLAASITRSEALLAETGRLGEKLAGVSRARLTLSERLAATQRKQGRLFLAQNALLKNSRRKGARLLSAEDERDKARARLTRQNKNILRLVAERQDLRAGLGRASLLLADLEKEKKELFARLSETQKGLGESERAGEILKSRVGGLESENARLFGQARELGGELLNLTESKLALEEKKAALTLQLEGLENHLKNDLAPLIHIMGRALGYSEKARRGAKSDLEKAGLMMEDMRLSFDVREANIRLKAAARELDLGEAAHGEKQALAKISEESASRLGRRNTKLRAALGALKNRYDGRLKEAGRTESGLRGLIDSQNHELLRQKRRLGELEPLLGHFLDQAGFQQADPMARAALSQLKEEAGLLREETSAQPLNSVLLGRLSELQPLVAFLARSFVSSVADLARARTEREDLAARLALEHDTLREKDSEILLLKNELAEADRDLAENDGRLEAAWAGLNYLNSKSGDSLDKMKLQLENETRRSDKLSLELTNRGDRIRELEERQNRLAILYWALAERAAHESGPADESAPAALPEIKREDEAREGDGQFFGAAKKAAGHAFLTLILAGGLIMGGAGPVAAAKTPPENPGLSASLRPAFLGCQVSLDFVESSVRLRGTSAVEERLKEKVREVAGEHSLSPREFLGLLRQGKGPEEVLHLRDFEGEGGAGALLARKAPRLSAALSGRSADLAGILKAAASFKPGEGTFWERIYFNLAEEFPPEKSLAALLKLLQRKESLDARAYPEFAGRLAPFPEVDNMAAHSFIGFMAGHMGRAWPLPAGRGRALWGRRLAGDLFFSARIYKLPLSVFAATLQWETEEGGCAALFDTRLSSIFMYKKAAGLARLARNGGEIWQSGQAMLCDLDEILAREYGPMGMENIFRKRLKIIMAYNKMTSSKQNLFGPKEPPL